MSILFYKCHCRFCLCLYNIYDICLFISAEPISDTFQEVFCRIFDYNAYIVKLSKFIIFVIIQQPNGELINYVA